MLIHEFHGSVTTANLITMSIAFVMYLKDFWASTTDRCIFYLKRQIIVMISFYSLHIPVFLLFILYILVIMHF